MSEPCSRSERAVALIASATSADPRRARALLAADPEIARHDLACACATGEADEVSRRLEARPAGGERAHRPERLATDPVRLLLAADCEAIRTRAPGIREVVRRATRRRGRSERLVHQRRPVAPGRAVRSGGDRGRPRTDPDAARGGRGRPPTTVGLPTADRDPAPPCEFPDGDVRAARDSRPRSRHETLVDRDLGRALNFPNPEMVEFLRTAARRRRRRGRRRPGQRGSPPRSHLLARPRADDP